MRNMATQLLPYSNSSTGKADNNKKYPPQPVTETLTNGFFTVDQKWTIKYWNKAAEKILGVLSKDIVGKNLWEKFTDVLPIEFYTVYQKAFLPGIPIHFEEYLGEMGAWFDIVIYYCDDTLSVSFKTSKQLQPDDPTQKLKTLTELYRFVTEVTNDCLWEWDLQAKEIFWIDGGHERVLGYPVKNALVPQSFWESCLHPEDKSRVLSKLNNIGKDEGVSLWEIEYRFKKADKEYVFVHDRGHIIFDEDKKPTRMIGATQDITARKLAELLLRSGLNLLDDKKTRLNQKIKNVIVELIHSSEPLIIKLSEHLSQELKHDYTYLANIFSEVQGTTIEKFYIAHKIERVKELLVYNDISLTKIAYQMHYSSVAHLSGQFKKVTGMTPSHFKWLKEKGRKML